MPSAIDRGFWYSWHDLPEQGRDEHLDLVHNTYIPKILKHPGVLWAAHFRTVLTAPGDHMHRTKDTTVPNGGDYVLIFGGENTAVFTKGRAHFQDNAPSKIDAATRTGSHTIRPMISNAAIPV